MKIRLHLLVLAAGAFLCASSAQAQKPTRNTAVSGNPSRGFEQGVISALNARLTASTRFPVTQEEKAELVVRLACLDHGGAGGVCSYTITYYPEELDYLGVVLTGPAIASAGRSFEIAENIFQDFVEVSTEENLKERFAKMLAAIRLYAAGKAKGKS
jgi:hypothetical protein